VLIYDLNSGEPPSENPKFCASAPVIRGLPSLAVSEDGTVIAAGDALGVSVFDTEGNLLDRYPQTKAITVSVSFVPGHHTLAIGSSDGTVVLWSYRTNPKMMPAFIL